MNDDDLKKKRLPDEGGEEDSGEAAESEGVDEMYEKFFGNKPKGDTIAEEVEEDEQARRTKPEIEKEEEEE